MLKRKDKNSKILYLAKIHFKNESKIKIFSGDGETGDRMPVMSQHCKKCWVVGGKLDQMNNRICGKG